MLNTERYIIINEFSKEYKAYSAKINTTEKKIRRKKGMNSVSYVITIHSMPEDKIYKS
jgi:hypothetical protein